MYFKYENGIWDKELIADLSKHPLAKDRPRLLEQEELFIDSKNRVHIFYKEFLDKDTSWGTPAHVHITKKENKSSEERILREKENLNWIRAFEVNGDLYYLYVFYDSAYIKKDGDKDLVKISLPKDAHGMYPYIATRKGGTSDEEKYIDILFLAADQKDFKDGTSVNYYVRISKSDINGLTKNKIVF